MRVVIAGGSGFLGRALAARLRGRGDEVVILTRGAERAPADAGGVRHVHWNAREPGEWSRWLEGARAVVNLVGRTVDCRKTDANKRVILESRVDSVKALAAGFKEAHNPPRVWVQSATAHIYGDTGEEILDEASPVGEGFAPMVGMAWEKALADADLGACRRVVLRISFVLGRDGGPLKTLARLARLFLGGTIGTGRHFMSWIHIDDLVDVIVRAIDDASMTGAYVVTAPGPVRNSEFMRQLRKAVHRPWSPPVPAFMVHIGAFLMRTDPELALLGRRLMPTRLLAEGFAFRFPELPATLADLLP